MFLVYYNCVLFIFFYPQILINGLMFLLGGLLKHIYVCGIFVSYKTNTSIAAAFYVSLV